MAAPDALSTTSRPGQATGQALAGAEAGARSCAGARPVADFAEILPRRIGCDSGKPVANAEQALGFIPATRRFRGGDRPAVPRRVALARLKVVERRFST